MKFSDSINEILSLSADPESGRADLLRLAGTYSKATGKELEPKCKEELILLRIFGNCPALAHRLIANPKWFHEICDSKFIKKKKPKDKIVKELKSVIDELPETDIETFASTLRRFKYREMTRIVARDIAGKVDTRKTLEEWSDVASAIIDAVYGRTFDDLADRIGRPTLTIENEDEIPCKGSIIALGKLGGHELNLSSDVDLLILYESDNGYAIAKDGRRTSNHEFFVKLTVTITKILSSMSSDGFLFRVDHELRPEGTHGTLANSIDAAERYYQYFGHDWERQALIRATPVAGDIELGANFIERMRPFVYRRSISMNDLAHMRRMKNRMEREAISKLCSFNIKLGNGGIRELEFFVQALQQFYGGNHPGVRSTNTFDAIEKLKKESLIHPYIAKKLTDAYSFLRRVENMLQAESDIQTHHFPPSEAGVDALAKRLGYRDEVNPIRDEFLRDFDTHTANVRKLFDALFEADYELQELEEAIRGNLETCSNEEEETDSLAWFKQQEYRRIQHLDLNHKIPLQTALRRLTLVADVIIKYTYELSLKGLIERYGIPKMNGKDAGFAIIGMGKLGSKEMDYGSDLDLCFIYSGSGKTAGDRSISNAEFFTKLAQRTISMASLPTRYGRAYAVDSELRPSGRSGALVTTLKSFMDYHVESAQIWERLALLKARVIAGDDVFLPIAAENLQYLAYNLPIPSESEIRQEIDRLRSRSIEERASSGENSIDIKVGSGGSNDLESAIQYYHLINVNRNKSLWIQNTFEVLNALGTEELVDQTLLDELMDNLLVFRLLISRLRLTTSRTTDIIEGTSDYMEHLAQSMDYKDVGDMIADIERRRASVERIYTETIKKTRD